MFRQLVKGEDYFETEERINTEMKEDVALFLGDIEAFLKRVNNDQDYANRDYRSWDQEEGDESILFRAGDLMVPNNFPGWTRYDADQEVRDEWEEYFEERTRGYMYIYWKYNNWHDKIDLELWPKESRLKMANFLKPKCSGCFAPPKK